MKIELRKGQPLDIIAQRFFGRLENNDAFYVDLWKEGDTLAVVVQVSSGTGDQCNNFKLAGWDDLCGEDEAKVKDVIKRNGAVLFGDTEWR